MKILIFALLMLAGCAANRQEQTATTRTVERVGIEQGQPTQITETTTERTALESKAQAGVDVSKAMQAGFAMLQGNLTSLIEAAKPAPVDFAPVIAAISAGKPAPVDFQPVLTALSAGKPGIDGTTGTLAGGLIGTALLAFQQHMATRRAEERARQEREEKERARKDADEEWKRANEATAREVELAKQLPPPVKT